MIKIKLNGEEKFIETGTTIHKLLEEMNIKTNMLVVEKNMEIIPADKYSSCEIVENDCLEIVGFFGGG